MYVYFSIDCILLLFCRFHKIIEDDVLAAKLRDAIAPLLGIELPPPEAIGLVGDGINNQSITLNVTETISILKKV